MDCDPHQPLTTPSAPPLTIEEAKARLRVAAQNVTLGALMSKRAWPLLAAAVAGGFVAARLRLPTLLGSAVIQRTVPILLRTLLGRKRSSPESPAGSPLKSK